MPLPSPSHSYRGRCDRHFTWLHLLSLPPNTEQTPSSCRTGVTSNPAHTGHMFSTPGHLCSNMAQSGVFLRNPGHLTSAPQAALLFSLVLTSFHLSCGTGNSSSELVLGHLGKGRAGLREGEDSLARVGPAQRKEETGVPSLED